jgi:hypothetical protein
MSPETWPLTVAVDFGSVTFIDHREHDVRAVGR